MSKLMTRDQTVTLRPEGLGSCCHPQIHRLGRQGSRLVYRADQDALQHIVDQSSGLPLFPIEEVFLDRSSVLVGCGTPNAAISVYREDDPEKVGWYKLAAFMLWRQAAYIAPAKGRLQSGLYLELRGLSEEAREKIWNEMNKREGTRGPSCARLSAEVLDAAGFTLGNGKSLKAAIRPSKYASLLWQHGIAYDGNPVDVRIVVTGDKGVGDHLKGAWLKEASAPGRTVRKIYAAKTDHASAPIFPLRVTNELDATHWTGYRTTVGVNRPSRLGVNLTFLLGQQPVYTIDLDHTDELDALQEPLQSFPGRLDRITQLKKNVLFARPVIRTICHFRNQSMDHFRDIPGAAILEMLTPSIGPAYETAVLYNCIVTTRSDGSAEARITALKNQDPASQNDKIVKTCNWILAKHVLMSNYHPQTVYACELWSYRKDGRTVLCLNNNSGTYKPSHERMEAFADYLRKLGNVEVETSLMEKV